MEERNGCIEACRPEPCYEAPCDRPCDDCRCEKKCVEMPSATTMIMGHIKARHIEIDQLDFGYTIRVGCQLFAIPSLKVLSALLIEYLKDPDGVEAKWRKGTLEI